MFENAQYLTVVLIIEETYFHLSSCFDQAGLKTAHV